MFEYDMNYNSEKYCDIAFPSKVNDCNFRKCIFDKVDFSNCDFSNSTFSKFANKGNHYKFCKLVGINLMDSHIDNVTFDECLMKYSNFSGCELNKTNFKKCNLEEASFITLKKFNKLYFDDCDMIKVDFFGTKLNNIDLRTCNISGIRIGLDGLKGLIVTSMQAIDLAYVLGINIKEIGEEI